MAVMERAVQLKKLVAVDGERYPKIDPLDVHTYLKAAFDKAANVGERHFPRKENVAPGKRCVFIEPVAKPGRSTLFHVYAYTAGHTPDQVVPDFDAAKAEVSDLPIVQDGKQVEVVQRFACAVLGEAIVIENARVYGAANLAIMAIREFIRRHSFAKFPRLILQDAPSREFKQLAKLHDGVVEVTARLSKDFTPEPDSFGASMENLISSAHIDAFKQITATVKGTKEEPLDPESVLKLVEESEGSTGLSGITVVFGDSTSLSDLETYRERHRITVQEIAPGRPAVTEIETAMVEYMQALVNPDQQNFRIIDQNGKFI